MVHGYKCFTEDLTSLYGDQFEIGKSYSVSGPIKSGIVVNGFHMCENIEDTFKYFNAMKTNVRICEVIGSGEMATYWDDYYGFEKIAVTNIEIVREVSREEIIQMALLFNEERALRFVQLFKLNSEEIVLFEEKFSKYLRVMDAIAYYQKGDLDVYHRRYNMSADSMIRKRVPMKSR